MNLKSNPLLLSLVLLLSTISQGQSPIIELDTLTLTTAAALPFDEPFTLKIPTKTGNVTSVGYIKHKGNKTLEETGKSVKFLKIVNPAFNTKKQGTQNYLLVSITNPNLLDPGKIYSFFWTEGVSDDVQKAFDDYDQYKRKGDQQAFKSAQEIIINIAKAYKAKTGVVTVFDPEDTELKTLEKYYSDKTSKFPEKYEKYLQQVKSYSSATTGGMETQLLNNAGLLLFAKTIVEKSEDFDSEIKGTFFKDTHLSLLWLNRLISIDATGYLELLRGMKPLECNSCKPEIEDDYNARLKNIKETISSIQELSNAANALRNIPGINPAASVLKNALADFSKSSENLQKVVEVRKQITDEITNIGISNFNVVGGNTTIKSFDSRTKLSIAPDFGVVTTRMFNDHPNPYSFVPYLGFHVNFRPLNRDIPFRSYHHKFVSYLSAFVGWSLVNVKNGPNLTSKADSIGGFFTGEKGTIMTGVGFRLGNAARITTGAMYYFKYPQNATTTLYDSRKLRVWPFIGFSLDLALKDLLNGITDVLTAAPRVHNPPSVSSN